MDYSLLIGLHTLPETLRNSNDKASRSECEFLFYKDFNGFRSSFEDNTSGPEVYYLGKKSERILR